jgi:hypothetical protein
MLGSRRARREDDARGGRTGRRGGAAAGDLGRRVRAGRRAERFRASPDLPNRFRRILGVRGMAGLSLGRLRRPRAAAAHPAAVEP